jgi:hypothetical protein
VVKLVNQTMERQREIRNIFLIMRPINLIFMPFFVLEVPVQLSHYPNFVAIKQKTKRVRKIACTGQSYKTQQTRYQCLT